MPVGSERASGTDTESEREEPGLPQEYSTTMDVSPSTRPPMPIPVSHGEMHTRSTRNTGRSGQSTRHSTGGTYQLVADPDLDTHHNRAYGAVDQGDIHRPGSQQGEAADYERPLLYHRDKMFGMNMKKYILSSLGMINIPRTSVSCSKCCKCP